MAQTTSVLWSVDQGLGEKAKEQARQNIGAASEKLTEVVNNHTEKIEANTTEIGQIKVDVADIESSLLNKKDKQQLKSFKGSSKQTIKNISQTENGELSVEFEVIDFPDFKLPSDVVRDSNYVHIDGATEVPLKDGITSVGVSTKYAREDHIHPTDTSREAIANKTTVILGTSNDKYPTDEAVAKFVNSSIATNTANYISNNSNPFTSVEQLNAYTGTVTNNDYAFVNGIDSDGNAYYDRYKATVNGSSVTWSLEYRLNNSSFTAAQWSAINSGITSALVAKIHEHSNKAVLDGITSDNVSNWNNKMDNQTVGSVSEPVYLENGIAKIATGVATKTDLNNLTEVVNGHTTEIGQIKDDVAGIESSLTNKKDKQSANTFTGSSTKTIKNISQNANGELNVEFEDIDMQNTYVSVNLTQDFTNEQKGTARTNIGAADASALKRLSNIVENNTHEIAGIKSRIAPVFGSGTVAYNSSGDNLICELSACKVYASISSENYCQLKVIADNTTIKSDKSIINSINGKFDGFRIYNTPWNNAGSYMVTANIPYDNNNYGTIDIDIMTSDSKLIHLIIWYKADIVNGQYTFNMIEEVKS